MTTLRIARRQQFVRLDSRAVNDPSLSYRSLGVLTWLLEKPDDWTVRAESIAAAKKEGRDAIRTALRELEAAGYLVRNKYRDGDGVWRSESVIYESPGGGQAGDNAGDDVGDNDATMTGNQRWLSDVGFPGALLTNQTHDSTNPLTPDVSGERKAAGRREDGTNPRSVANQRREAEQALCKLQQAAEQCINMASRLDQDFPHIHQLVFAGHADHTPALVTEAAAVLVTDHPSGKALDWWQAADVIEDRLRRLRRATRQAVAGG